MDYTKGKRVCTFQGLATIKWVRMAPPTYSTVASVCVLIDARKDDPGYTGTVYPAGDVWATLDDASEGE